MPPYSLEIKNFYTEKNVYPAGKSLFQCSACASFALEMDAYDSLTSKFADLRAANKTYLNYYLASRHAGKPEDVMLFTELACSKCRQLYKAFFYKKFEEQYFAQQPREFFLVDIEGSQSLENTIDGVYSREVCQVFLQKLMLRWNIVKDYVIAVVPFIGNPWQTPEERLTLLSSLLYPLDPRRALLLTRPKTLTTIQQDFDIELGTGAYNALASSGRLNPVLINAFRKADFHAKFFAGINQHDVESLIGSHNLHGGSYMENMLFKRHDHDTFIDRYLFQINCVPARPPLAALQALVFTQNQGKWLGKIETYSANATQLMQEYYTKIR